MSDITATEASFIVLQVGRRRFGLPANKVVELAPPVRLHKFPHKTPLVTGVIVRRGRIVPVYDAASVLVGQSAAAQRFYLITRLRIGEGTGFAAMPVNGECELASGEAGPPPVDSPPWVTGTLSLNGELAELLDFHALIMAKPAGERASSEETPS